MELRLGNQQRHSITAVLLSAVVVIFGLVLVDIVSSPEPDPLGARTEAFDTASTSTDAGLSEAGEDITAGVARSNARFTLNPDVTVADAGSSTTTVARRTTSAAIVTTDGPITTASATTTVTETSDTSGSSSTSSTSSTTPTASTTSTTAVDPPEEPSTTVDGDETTTTKKCRGNRPGCRDPRP